MTSTIAAVLAGHAEREPGAPAIVSAGFGTLSFGSLTQHVHRVGAAFATAGVGPSSRVGIALPRGPEAAVLNVACSLGKISMEKGARGVAPFVLAQIVLLLMFIAFPNLIMVPFEWLK